MSMNAVSTSSSSAPVADAPFLVRPLSPFGAEIIGLDLDRELDAATCEALRRQWVASGILLLRGAARSVEAHMRLSRCFGTLQPSATQHINLADNPYLMGLRQDPAQRPKSWTAYHVHGQVRTGWLGWHWDQAFMPEIVRGAVLRMIEPPLRDGRTGFIDAIAAWERLPPALQRRIEGLEVVYHFNGAQERNRFGFPDDLRLVEAHPDREAMMAQLLIDFPPVVHPLVITQLETGRKVLKLSPMHARHVLGMDEAESDALLHELAGYLVDERHAYYHTWQPDDVIVWDNWRVIHSATGVPLDVSRYAQRTTLVGDYKLGRYLDPAREGQAPTRRLDD